MPKNLLDAVKFVCGEIEESDKDSLYVTPTRGTRVQIKLGPYIDTFSAAVLLPEVKDQMPDDAGQEAGGRRPGQAAGQDPEEPAARRHLGRPGLGHHASSRTWPSRGSTAPPRTAAGSMKRSAQQAEEQARKSFDKASGKFDAEGSAGVQLYSAGANLEPVSESVKTNKQQKGQARADRRPVPPRPPAAKAEASATLKSLQVGREGPGATPRTAVIARLDDKQFIAGFGSNGGEEFLSYMNIGESLVVKGGDAWKAWDKSISENLNRVQNSDGSWSGHHCITGRTFCTSAALLVLMVDRSPLPISEKMKRR